MDKLALYVHWPYCTRICPYCDFNVYKARGQDAGELLAALLDHMKIWREMSGPRELISIHFGGGTPSLMSAVNVGKIIELASALWSPAGNIEIALEANPTDADRAVWQDYKTAGLNRLSLGIQSFDNDVLTRLGRDHDSDKAREALALARNIFENISGDLIYGHAGQSLAEWTQDLETALEYTPDHISAYQLTLEPGTAFARKAGRGETLIVDGDASADLYEATRARLRTAGFEDYEVSNYAKTPNARSKHNMAYWTHIDYAAIGPGGHARLEAGGHREAFINEAKPDAYMKSVGSAAQGFSSREILTPKDRASEYLLMGLRVKDGISLERFSRLAGAPISTSKLEEFTQTGLIAREGETIRTSDTGRLLLDRISHELLIATF